MHEIQKQKDFKYIIFSANLPTAYEGAENGLQWIFI